MKVTSDPDREAERPSHVVAEERIKEYYDQLELTDAEWLEMTLNETFESDSNPYVPDDLETTEVKLKVSAVLSNPRPALYFNLLHNLGARLIVKILIDSDFFVFQDENEEPSEVDPRGHTPHVDLVCRGCKLPVFQIEDESQTIELCRCQREGLCSGYFWQAHKGHDKVSIYS